MLRESTARPTSIHAHSRSAAKATDAALIIDAMDLLHHGSVDGFCLDSSDCDFTRLTTRIRDAGLAVYGFGEKKTDGRRFRQ